MIGIAEFGERELSGNFSWDNNEIHRKIYIKDFDQIQMVLNVLFGDPAVGSSNVYTPHQFPSPFSSFYAWGVTFTPVHQKSTYGSSDISIDVGNITTFLNNLPTIQGGVILDITYRPYDIIIGTNDESADYSAHVMTILSNAISQLRNKDGTSNALSWKSDGEMVTNLSGIIKIIPKIELISRKLFLKHPPTIEQIAKIGCVNSAEMSLTTDGNPGAQRLWPKQTLLLSGLPTVRRWRYDGQPVYEVTLKFSANMYKDLIIDDSGAEVEGYVGWNRLFRVIKGRWERVTMPPAHLLPIYPEEDLSFVNTAWR